MESIRARQFQGSRLRALRKARGLSQTQLGLKVGAHVTSVSDWERGDNAPSGRHVASLAREFGVPMEHFYGDPDDEEDAPVAEREFMEALRPLARLFAERIA